MRVWGCFVAGALVACSVDPVQLEGRTCPCVAGWVCDGTNHCVIADGSVSPEASDDGGADASDADAGNLIFDEEFDGGTLDTTNKWVVGGDGNWFIQNGLGEQSNGSSSTAILYAQGFATATDYHIVTRMHSTGPFDAGQDLAPEIAFRIDPTQMAFGVVTNVRCNVDLQQNQLLIQATTTTLNTTLDTTNLPIPPNFDASTWFVLDAVVTGSAAKCTVTFDGNLPTVAVTTNQLPIASGPFGLKTYTTQAEFAYFRVYSVP
ncbi:MAG TPA: hypothetical protein VGH28_33045 [Polyangiaceae bacterium]|jgi:hypothetical protein